MPSKHFLHAIRKALSPARFETFEIASAANEGGGPSAVDLYGWNAQVAAALFMPLHICEVVLRNAIADALEQAYGSKWPWSQGFERSLRDPASEWSPRRELVGVRRRFRNPSQVIPELKFAFWQDMMTQRHDRRLWDSGIHLVFPNLDSRVSTSQLRHGIYLDIKTLRELRNRIAHHEPILKRDLMDDYQRMVRLVERRCSTTSGWMAGLCKEIPKLIESRPVSLRSLI